jgi:predicted dehydrogenase
MRSAGALRIGLIGLGRWGTNYARTIRSLDGLELAVVSCRGECPSELDLFSHARDWRALLDWEDLDGVVIASPPETHYEIASALLARGLPIILEKPACYSVNECNQLMELSLVHNVPCLVGYTHLYSSAYRRLKLLNGTDRFTPKINSVGLSNGPFRENVAV